jgi:hypothetical protein
MFLVLTVCITAASNLAAQVYQCGTKFCDKPLMSHPFPQLFCFDIFPSSAFLCALSTTPIAVEGGLQISQDDLDLFKKLKAQPKKISDTIKALKKHNKSGTNNQPDSDKQWVNAPPIPGSLVIKYFSIFGEFILAGH